MTMANAMGTPSVVAGAVLGAFWARFGRGLKTKSLKS